MMMPVGRWSSCTALSVFCTCCPPGPGDRHVDHTRSLSQTSTDAITSSSRIATVIVLDCTRPRFSVGGILCQRWPPASPANTARAPRPHTPAMTSPARRSTTQRLKLPPQREATVDRQLFLDEQLGIRTALGGTDLDDDCFLHGLHDTRRASTGQRA